jgi:hypothetical protein
MAQTATPRYVLQMKTRPSQWLHSGEGDPRPQQPPLLGTVAFSRSHEPLLRPFRGLSDVHSQSR